jgi:predicted nuclease of predicted toxin-antitoxin system
LLWWAWNQQLNDFVIVTKDSDFEELGVIEGTPPKVIWIKIGNTQNKVILDVLLKNKMRIYNALSQEEISCVELYE